MNKPTTFKTADSLVVTKSHYQFGVAKFKLSPVVIISCDSDTLYYNKTLRHLEETNIPDPDLRSAKSLESIAKSMRVMTTIQVGILIATIVITLLS
jgi:hypothetical protein